MNSNPNQVSLSTEKFAGRLRHFLPAWSSITTDQNILDIVQLYNLEIETPNQSRPRPEIQFDSNEKEIIDLEITHLFKLGVIEPAVHSPGEYISTIFVRKKKSGKYRMILNLKGLNKHIEKHHFQNGHAFVCCATDDPTLYYGLNRFERCLLCSSHC